MGKQLNIKSILKAFSEPVIREWPLWLAIVFTLVPDTWTNLLYHIRVHNMPIDTFKWAVSSMSVIAVFAYIVVFIVTKVPHRRLVKWVIYVILLAIWLVSLFLINNFSTTYTPEVLQLLIETNANESSEFLSTWIGAPGTRRSIIIVVLTLSLILLAEYKRVKVMTLMRKFVPSLVVTVVLLVMLMQGLWIGRRIVHRYSSLYELELYEGRYYSTDAISTLCSSIVKLKLHQQETWTAIDLAVKTAKSSDAVNCLTDSMDLVLVIGESYNKWHSSLYGYGLETSPLMRAERDQGLLAVFTNVVSPYNLTSVVIKNMLSLNSLGCGERWQQSPIWTAVMKSAGWQVYWWDNQRDYKQHEFHTASLMDFLFNKKMVDHIYHAVNDQTFQYDKELVDDYFQKNRPGKRNLVVFHLMGQHTAYDSRYPHDDRWEQWTTNMVPVAQAPYMDESRREVVLHFDRATLYNDYILSVIINHYRYRNAVVVMLSDHGEEVYDYRDFMERDHNPLKSRMMVKFENEVPMFIWCSPVYKARHPERASAIVNAVNQPLMTDVIGQMMLWLGGVESQWNDSTRNVLHPAYRPVKRLIYDTIDYDQLMSGNQ